MANTYSQSYIQVVFALEGRQNLLPPEHNDELQKDQQRHHERQTFREEYVHFLRKFEIDCEERHIFKTD